MRKIISCVLCLAMVLSMGMTAFAADISTDGGSQNVTVTYGTSESFLVTIPASITILDEVSDFQISASNVMIGANKELVVEINGDDYVDKWELIDVANPDNRLEYAIQGPNGDVKNNDTVLSVLSGEVHDSTKTADFVFVRMDEATKSGTYTDTLTFNVEVIGGSGSTGAVKVLSDVLDREGIARVNVGDKVQLEIPTTYNASQPVWTSNDETIISVTASGLATALIEGITTVSYTIGDESGNISFVVGDGSEVFSLSTSGGYYDFFINDDGNITAILNDSADVLLNKIPSLGPETLFVEHNGSSIYVDGYGDEAKSFVYAGDGEYLIYHTIESEGVEIDLSTSFNIRLTGANMFSFIDEFGQVKNFKYTPGMTYREWVESEYNNTYDCALYWDKEHGEVFGTDAQGVDFYYFEVNGVPTKADDLVVSGYYNCRSITPVDTVSIEHPDGTIGEYSVNFSEGYPWGDLVYFEFGLDLVVIDGTYMAVELDGVTYFLKHKDSMIIVDCNETPERGEEYIIDEIVG